MVSHVGYVVDPVAELPELGTVTYIHAVATNNSTCQSDIVAFQFYLPPGASFAGSGGNPVSCFVGKSGSVGPAPMCLQQPLVASDGSLFFGMISGLNPQSAFEVQVPVVFNTPIAGAALQLLATSVTGNLAASVGITAPFQPTPNPYTNGRDLALVGSGLAAGTLPIAHSNDDGTFTTTNYPVGAFATWSTQPSVKRLSGDFNGDGFTDFALVGGPGWQAIPVAMSLGNGQFTITDLNVGPTFNAFAAMPGAKVLAADFNHDGMTDIAIVGNSGTVLPIAFSFGNGAFNVTMKPINNFAAWATQSGAIPLVGDFNRDGFADIALVGGAGWNTVPVAFSYGDGSFLVTNSVVQQGSFNYGGWGAWNFAASSQAPNVHAVTGDFNGDGATDLALVGGNMSTVRVALSYGNGTFSAVEGNAPNFSAWGSSSGVEVLTGDFNGDGYTDIALTGVAGWRSIPTALSVGWGNFSVTNPMLGDFGDWASTPGARAIAADFNGDGRTDIALTGGAGWASIPVAFSTGNGSYNVVNAVTRRFPSWSSESSASIFAGRLDN